MVLGLGPTQTLIWASSYYLPALLAAPLAAELGVLALLQGLALRQRSPTASTP